MMSQLQEVLSNCKLVVFDIAGTTVDDVVDGVPLMISCMIKAFSDSDIQVDESAIHKHRGKEKRAAIADILSEVSSQPLETEKSNNLVDTIFSSFKDHLRKGVGRVKALPGVVEAFRALHGKGMKLVVSSGFPPDVVEGIVSSLGWYSTTDDSTGEVDGFGVVNRPNPDFIHSMMDKFGVKDPKHVLKVGDTKIDVEEGKNAGVWTLSVLTGTQPKELLESAKPDFILDSVASLASIANRR